MTIIIETPQPPVRERLVRIPAECIDDAPGAHEVHTDRVYNATPADLERAGWVPLSAFVEPLDLLSPPTRAGALDAIAALMRERERWAEESVRAEAERDEARRERDEARALASAHARALGRATDREDGAAAERARVVAYLRRAADVTGVGAQALVSAAHRIERGDHAKGEAPAVDLPWDADGILARAERVRAERVRAECVRAEREALAVEAVTPENVGEVLARAEEVARYHREQEAGRATDEELVAAYRAGYSDSGAPQEETHKMAMTRGVRAVAERVRRERCLIARCVEAGADVEVLQADATSWDVRLTVVLPKVGRRVVESREVAADVPATLARLLGEVGE